MLVKTVTIHYPDVSKNRYVFEYSLDGGIHWTITQELNTEIWFSENGSIIARVRDTYNERDNLNGGVFNVTRIDKIPPTCVSSGGSTEWTNGTRKIIGVCSDTGESGCKGNISYTYNAAENTNWNINNAGPAGAGQAGTVYDNVGNCTVCPANQHVHVTNKLDAPIITNLTGGNWVNYSYALTVKTPNNKVNVAYWQWRYANTSWATYSNSAKNTFTTTQYTTERNEATYIRYCISSGQCSSEASTMIRIDKTPPYWRVAMHAGGYHYSDGSYQPFTCYAKIDIYDPASGLEGIYNLVGNSGSIMMEHGPLYGAAATGPDGFVMGSFGAYYAYYGFSVCDMVGNCANQPRVAGYC